MMKKLGKFEILSKIGQGAMGVVYKARDPYIGRIVALKTITTGLAESPDLLKRFYGEAQSAGRLQHPNIVTIFELGNEGDTPFIAMEFLTGESLDKLIARHARMPLSQKLGYIVHVCRALEYAHRQNPSVIHRDIKPGNVMVTSDGTVKVVDFGIARLGEGSHSQSSGMLIGTLGYMSPQQFRGGSADARSDIWATGIMLYELLCYHRPFDAENPGALMTSIMLDQHRPISEAAPGTPAEVEAIVDRMLCKELDARYQNMEEVLMALEPVWNQVQEAEVSSLVADGQQFFEARDLAKAEDIVRKALQIDTSNTQAKSLLERINAELRRSKIIQQVKTRVESGQNLLSAGQIEEAKAEVEAALRLDSTFQPAKELLEQVQAAAERVRLLANALRASKQRLAEGALTEAELQLDKVLEMDPQNSAAQDLLKQIRDEKARRERQRRLAETLHRARTFWTNLQYDECISELLGAEKEFPGEPEIVRLLHTAREDQAEQQRQSLLSEARKLLSAQRFEETLEALDRLLERFPSDPTAKNLRTLALQGQEQEKRERKLNENLTKLRAMVEKGKYQEVIESGQKLLEEFPGEFELVELMQFARSEQIQIEQKRRLDEWIKRIQQSVRDERFPVAIQDVQKALKEFPQDVELLILSERAKKGQEAKEREDLLRQRLQEVEKRLERQELTEAINLARQTLVTVGPHPGLANLLHRAEMEFEQRNKRKREQEEALERARTLLEAGNLGDATLILENAVETRLFTKSDPRFAPLLDEIGVKKQQHRVEAALRELRGLLTAGRHREVIEQGEALLRELPRDVQIRELVEFAQEELSREQQRQKEKECEREIQSLLEKGCFLEAEEAAIRAAKAYPKQANFRRQLEEARSRKREQDERERLRQEIERRKEEQRKKEEQERQVGALRTVIEQGNLAEATQLLNQAIAAKILEHSDAQVRQLESEIAEQERKIEERRREEQRKKEEQDRQVGAVRTMIEQENLAEATKLLNQAIAATILRPSDPQVKQLESKIAEEKRKIEERRREEQRKKEEQDRQVEAVRTMIEQENLAEATRLLNQAIAAKILEHSDAQVRQLESEIAEQKRKIEERRREEQRRKEEQERQAGAVRTVIEQGNLAEATQLLNQAIAAKILERSDTQVRQLESEIAEKKRRVEQRKKRVQRVTEDLRGLLRKGKFAEVIESGQRAVEAEGHQEEIAGLIEQAKIALTKQESLQKRSLAELQSIRDLLSEGEVHQAKKVLEDALRQGILERGDQEVVELQRKAEELTRRDAEPISAVEPKLEEPSAVLVTQAKTSRKKWMLGAIAAGVLVAVVSGSLYFKSRPPTPPPRDNDEGFWEKAQTAMSESPKDFRTALDEYEKVLEHRGMHQTQAQAKIDEIKALQGEEEKLIQQAQQALSSSQPDYQAAISLLQQVVKIDGDRKADAELLLNRAEELSKGADPTALAQEDLNNADKLLAASNWEGARRLYQQVKQTSGIPSSLRSRAADGYKKADLHVNEEDLWKRAVAAEKENRLSDARNMFEKVEQMGLGHKTEAEARRRGIEGHIAAENLEKTWDDLKVRIDQSKNSQDKQRLGELQRELSQFANGNGPHSAEAKELDRRISESVSKINTEEAWTSLEEQYRGALSANDKASLGQIANKLKAFMNGGPHAQEAVKYTENIERLLHPLPPPTPPTQTSQNSPCELPDKLQNCNAIKDLVEVRLSEAFDQHSIQKLQLIWPALSGMKDSRQKYKTSFDGASKLSRRYSIAKWEFLGPDEVTVSGSYSGEYTGRDGQRYPGNGHFYIQVIQNNGRWVIKDILD